jgi:hypothetical protein
MGRSRKMRWTAFCGAINLLLMVEDEGIQPARRLRAEAEPEPPMASRDRLDIAFVIMIALAFLALTSAASENEPFTGTVLPDAHWSTAHTGSKYVLEEEGTGDVFALRGQETALALLSGQRVTVIGSESDDQIHVSSVYAARESEPAPHVERIAITWRR